MHRYAVCCKLRFAGLRSSRQIFKGTNMTDSQKEPGGFWTEAGIWLAVLALIAVWGFAIWQWGVFGLYVPAAILVPIIMLVLVWISRG